MKVEKYEYFQNKRSSTGCKWSSLNGPCTENSQSYFSAILSDSDINMYVFVVPVRARGAGEAEAASVCFYLFPLCLKPAFDNNSCALHQNHVELKSDFCHVKCHVCEVDDISV